MISAHTQSDSLKWMCCFFAYALSSDMNAVEIRDSVCMYLFFESLRLMES